MVQSANRQALDFGTGAPKDGETLVSGFTKVENNFSYLFDLADTMARYVGVVSDLEGLTDAEDNEVFITRGYRTEGDGGSNAYYYDSAASDTCNGVTVLDGIGGSSADGDSAKTWAGSGTGRFKALNPDACNLYQAGAYGDSTNAAVNPYRIGAAIDACRNVHVPRGTFQVDDDTPMTFTSSGTGRYIHGDGWESIIEQTTADECIFCITGSVNNWTFHKIRFLGSGSGTTTTKNSAIYTTGGFQVVISECIFENFNVTGVHLTNSTAFTVKDCLFWKQTGANATLASDLLVDGNTNRSIHVLNNRLYSDVRQNMYLATNNVSTPGMMLIEENHIQSVNSSGWPVSLCTYRQNGIYIDELGTLDTTDFIIRGNSIETSKAAGIYVQGVASSFLQQLVIENNMLLRNGQSGVNHGLEVVNGAFAAMIRNNTVLLFSGNVGTYAMYVVVDTDSNLVISNNTIRSSTNATHGIGVLGCDFSIIDSNFIEVDGAGVIWSTSLNTTQCEISNNTIRQNGTEQGIWCISSHATPLPVVIKNNNLHQASTSGSGYADAAIYIQSGPYVIENNYIDSYPAGIAVVPEITGRTMGSNGPDPEATIRNNVIKDCTTCFEAGSSATTAVLPVFGNAVSGYSSLTGPAAQTNEAVYIASEVNGLLRVTGTSSPSNGTWIKGDQVWDTDYSGGASEPYAWICSSGGTPGAWQAITA